MSVPTAPQIFIRPDALDSSLLFFWTAPLSNGGSPITSYLLSNANPPLTQTVGSNTQSTAITGLTNGTTYSFVIAASNANGLGATAAFRSVQPGLIPPAPTNPSYSNLDAITGDLSIQWTNPSNPNNAQIIKTLCTAQRVTEYSTLTTNISSLTFGTTFPTQTQRFIKLNPSYSYQVLVQSINDPGYCLQTCYTSTITFSTYNIINLFYVNTNLTSRLPFSTYRPNLLTAVNDTGPSKTTWTSAGSTYSVKYGSLLLVSNASQTNFIFLDKAANIIHTKTVSLITNIVVAGRNSSRVYIYHRSSLVGGSFLYVYDYITNEAENYSYTPSTLGSTSQDVLESAFAYIVDKGSTKELWCIPQTTLTPTLVATSQTVIGFIVNVNDKNVIAAIWSTATNNYDSLVLVDSNGTTITRSTSSFVIPNLAAFYPISTKKCVIYESTNSTASTFDFEQDQANFRIKTETITKATLTSKSDWISPVNGGQATWGALVTRVPATGFVYMYRNVGASTAAVFNNLNYVDINAYNGSRIAMFSYYAAGVNSIHYFILNSSGETANFNTNMNIFASYTVNATRTFNDYIFLAIFNNGARRWYFIKNNLSGTYVDLVQFALETFTASSLNADFNFFLNSAGRVYVNSISTSATLLANTYDQIQPASTLPSSSYTLLFRLPNVDIFNNATLSTTVSLSGLNFTSSLSVLRLASAWVLYQFSATFGVLIAHITTGGTLTSYTDATMTTFTTTTASATDTTFAIGVFNGTTTYAYTFSGSGSIVRTLLSHPIQSTSLTSYPPNITIYA